MIHWTDFHQIFTCGTILIKNYWLDPLYAIAPGK